MSESAKRRCSTDEWKQMQHQRGTILPLEDVKRWYAEGYTQAEIGSKLGVSQKVVWRFMKNNGIKARTATKRDQYLDKNDSWKGGIVRDTAGYVLVKKDGHPRAKKCGGYVREHILVAEDMMGRALSPNEVVHHKNGIKNDNRPENLQVMTRVEHTRLHSLMRIKKA